MTNLERWIKKLFSRFGILVRKYNTGSSEGLRRNALFKKYGINLVFDIGANNGQYAKDILDTGYRGEIVSFEPMKAVHEKLFRASKKIENWHVPESMALGQSEGELEINVTQNLVSSTFLSIAEAHISGEPKSKIVRKERVKVRTLNQIALSYLSSDSKIFIKMDVQGFEEDVIKGGENIFNKALGVEMEVSLVPLYNEKIWLLSEVLAYMTEKGFTLKSISPAFTDAVTGEMLQCNAIFFKDLD